ncbi:MAG: hypothetical protein K2F79_00965 [Muribaculaceae bacterium]|nr:hypothetical protein [Muribaculaceae bacterium]
MESNIFSLRRIRLLAGFYSPFVRRQLIWAGIATALCYLISLYSAIHTSDISDMGLYSLSSMVMGIVYLCGPLALGYCPQRGLATTLPASWVEKGVLAFAYVLVIYPLFLALVWYGLMWVAALFTPCANVTAYFTDLVSQHSAAIGINLRDLVGGGGRLNVFSSVMMASVVCYFITAIRTQRISKGVAVIVGTLFVQSVIGGIIGVIAILRSGLFQAIESNTRIREEDIGPRIVDEFAHLMPYVTAMSVIICISFVALTFRKLKMRQN